MKTYAKVLTIAGSDSGGGAGIQADLKTFCALGCFGMSAITALTAQNTCTITDIFPVPARFIRRQIDAVMTDMGTNAVKTGMLHSPEAISIVADRLEKWHCTNIVVDPVMVSTSGNALVQKDAVSVLKTSLFPLATIITPNLPEASVLLNREIKTLEEMIPAAKQLSGFGCKNVLLKGGHLSGKDACDILYQKDTDTILRLAGHRINTPNTHGTGCTLSSAIAANLAKGFAIDIAVKNAKTYITGALSGGKTYITGNGHGPVHHFYDIWSEG